jgi:heme exporter protein D
MPDLDRYVGTVLGAYAVTLLLLGGLLLVSLWRAARVRRALAETEAGVGRGADATRKA